MKEKEIALLANKTRQMIVRMLVAAKSGHTAGSLGMADIFTILYHDWLKVDPKAPFWSERDYFLVSNGHICPVWYAVLAQRGFFPEEELGRFRKIDSLLQGHPHNTTIPGVENSGGPLGQGLSQACGVALALKRDGRPNRVYCVCGDGEHNEGQAWEAALFAGHYGLDNLCLIMDRNHIQIDNFTEKVMHLEPLGDKFRAFGFHVLEIDGHRIREIKKALKKAEKSKGRPSIIIANTTPGKGVAEFENNYEWHGKPPDEAQAISALKELEKEREQLQNGRWR